MVGAVWLQEVYRVLRLLSGARMLFMIDDKLTACGSDRAMAMARAECTLTLLAALRYYLGLPKCQLLPQYRAPMLGMIVETDFVDADGKTYARFLLPEEKLRKLEHTAKEVGGEGQEALCLLCKAG